MKAVWTRAAIRDLTHIREYIARENPDEYAEPLALTLQNLVLSEYESSNPAGAREASDRIIEIYRDLSLRNPALYRIEIATWHKNLALLTRQSGDIEKAEKHCIKAVEQWRELAEESHGAVADEERVVCIGGRHGGYHLALREKMQRDHVCNSTTSLSCNT